VHDGSRCTLAARAASPRLLLLFFWVDMHDTNSTRVHLRMPAQRQPATNTQIAREDAPMQPSDEGLRSERKRKIDAESLCQLLTYLPFLSFFSLLSFLSFLSFLSCFSFLSFLSCFCFLSFLSLCSSSSVSSSSVSSASILSIFPIPD